MISYSVPTLALLLSGSIVSAFFPLHQNLETHANRLGGVEYEAKTKENSLSERDGEGDAPGIFISISPFRSNTHYRVRSPSKRRDSILITRDNKYTIVPAQAPSKPNSVAIDEDGTDYSYFSTAEIGSQAEKMMLLVDTGSSVTWVMDDSCKSGPCGMHNTFASSKSTTLKAGQGTFSLDYGTGEVKGSYATDTLSIAGLNITTPIGLADTVSSDFQNYPFDGILGLGRIPLDGSSSTTFLKEVIQSKDLSANVFGVNLQRNDDKTADGEVNFGAPDTSKYQGDLSWTNTVDDQSFWQIPADDILVDGKSINLNQKRTAILDTGTSYMLIPPNDAKTLFGAIQGASAGDNGFWNVPCKTKQDIQVVFSGIGYSISPKDYVGRQPSPGGLCQSNIIGVSAAGNDQTWLLGDTFMKNVYTVFDADKNWIGFGAKSGSTKVNSGSSSSSSLSASSVSSGTNMATSNAVPSGTSVSSGSKPSITGLELPAANPTTSPTSPSASEGRTASSSAAAPSTNAAGKFAVCRGGTVSAFGLAMFMFL